MRIPKNQKKYCPFCRKHTQHSVEEAKRRPRRQDTRSQRRFLRKMRGYGSFPKENPKGREKPTRKTDFRYKCGVCGKKHTAGTGFRIKKFELASEKAGTKASKQQAQGKK
ncbi:MAG: 50S ribosomal protein L44e [Candidatus Aenigmarchaeota archaeon]|nr:50S ribosomal protein L44e [Candidatus Aenigmarchaeota archaeon]